MSDPDAPALRRILIVDDDLDVAEVLRDVLTARGLDVAVAHDGGLRLARAHRPDLVLCDLRLPGLDGLDLAAAIRDDPALASTVLIAVTGSTSVDDRARVLAGGFDGFLAKPLSLAAIDQALAATR